MPDYPKMYAILCAAASAAIDLIETGNAVEAARNLQQALYRAEELYVESGEENS